VSKIPSSGGLSPSTSTAGKSSKFPSDPLASTGSALAFQKHAAARKAAAAGSGDGAPASVAATISKAKEALAQARARAQAAGSLASGVSSRVVEGAVSDKPFTLYGKVDLPPPKPQVKIHPPDAEEAAKRK
jgi:hypothetical protein